MEIKDLYYTSHTTESLQLFDWHIEDNQSKQW